MEYCTCDKKPRRRRTKKRLDDCLEKLDCISGVYKTLYDITKVYISDLYKQQESEKDMVKTKQILLHLITNFVNGIRISLARCHKNSPIFVINTEKTRRLRPGYQISYDLPNDLKQNRKNYISSKKMDVYYVNSFGIDQTDIDIGLTRIVIYGPHCKTLSDNIIGDDYESVDDEESLISSIETSLQKARDFLKVLSTKYTETASSYNTVVLLFNNLNK